jgi:probable HAF family extracellular repeat protein
MNYRIITALAVTGLVVAPVISRAATVYTISGIAPQSGDDVTFAAGINNTDQIIGTSEALNLSDLTAGPTANPSGFILQGTSITILPSLGTNSKGFNFTQPYAINDSGQVVGLSTSTTGGGPALVDGDNVTDLSPILGSKAIPAAINNSAVVVGDTRSSTPDGFIYNGSLTVINTGGLADDANDVNSVGVVAGDVDTSASSGHSNAFYYDGTIHTIGTLPGVTDSFATLINDAGNLAGWSGNVFPNSSVPKTRPLAAELTLFSLEGSGAALSIGETSEFLGGDAFFYNTATQKMTDLGNLGGGFSAPLAMNDSGDIVGISLNSSGDYNAFFDDGSAMVNLNSLIAADSGWTLFDATGINNAGDIVGFGELNGNFEAFELTPGGTISGTGGNGGTSGTGGSTGGTGGSTGVTAVPLPSAVWSGMVLLGGLLGIGAVRSRRVSRMK